MQHNSSCWFDDAERRKHNEAVRSAERDQEEWGAALAVVAAGESSGRRGTEDERKPRAK